jgi:hypothetical protein
MSAAPTLGVVIVPARGGSDLDAALVAADWADVRAVLAVTPAPPPTVRDVTTVAEPGDVARLAPAWVLVLFEHERILPDAVDDLRAAIADAPADTVFALPVMTSLLDMDVRLRRPIARLAPRGTTLVLGGGLSLAFAVRGSTRELDVTIFRARGATLDRAVALMGAEAGALAGLVDRLGGPRGVIRQSVRAALRAVTARAARPPLGVGRWIVAVFEGYRVVVAYARLWERRRDRRPGNA